MKLSISLPKQRQIVRLCFKGCSNRELSEKFNLSKEDIYKFRSQNGLTISLIDKMKKNKINSAKWLANHHDEFYSEASIFTDTKCDCCGKPASSDVIYTLPDGTQAYFCEDCIKMNDYLESHSGKEQLDE